MEEGGDGVAPFRALVKAVEATTHAEGASRRLDGGDGGRKMLTAGCYGHGMSVVDLSLSRMGLHGQVRDPARPLLLPPKPPEADADPAAPQRL